MSTVFQYNIFSSLVIILSVLILGCSGGEKESVSIKDLSIQARELQKDQKFDLAVKIYRKIIKESPGSHDAGNAQFMIGYIYANHLKDLEQAKIELNRFLEKYSDVADSGLVAGAKFELNYLGKDIEDIPILSQIGSDEEKEEKKE